MSTAASVPLELRVRVEWAREQLDEIAHEWFTSREFDDVLVQTVTSTFPAHEHEQFVAHYRGLLGSWATGAA